VTDALGLAAASADVPFSTVAVFPLQILGLQAVALSDTHAVVSWQTNKPARSELSYGPSAAYELGSVVDSLLRTTHEVTLQSLTPGTQYHYNAHVEDGAGQTSDSGDRIFTTPSQAPVITVWYGDDQSFGHLGKPQTWVNILGNVSDPQGVQSLRYSLNAGALQSLSLGPSNARLAAVGDFNVEIAYTAMNTGINTVRIVAVDTQGNQSERTVFVDVTHGLIWPGAYTATWSSVTRIEDAAQIVDGEWSLQGATVRSIAPGYDRLIAIGDVTWRNYEVTATITTHSIDPAGFPPPGNGPAIGIALRWGGHVNWNNSQPNIGYYPLGALAIYHWQPDGVQRFMLLGNRANRVANDTTGRLLELGRSYVFKAQVLTEADGQHLYRFKAWPIDESEPANWQLQIRNGNLADDPSAGSLLLLSHHVDASFGDVVVQPLP
jgi:hypothetical protein